METRDEPLVRSMIKDLYAGLLSRENWITDEKISATFKLFQAAFPKHLKIDVIEIDQQLVG
jgi:hypothetical protein